MRTTERFTSAVTKLYNAFHAGTLNAFDCTACAVGSIVGSEQWFYELWQTASHGKHDIMQIKLTAGNPLVYETGYTTYELMRLEEIFLSNFDSRGAKHEKQSQFKGLCAVVEYLCELDGIPNVMDYTKLFETENNQPKHELSL